MLTVDLNLDWKEFNVDMDLVLHHIKDLTPLCVGISANSKVQIHFSDEPGDVIRGQIESYWNSIDEECAEATEYKSLTEVMEQAEEAKSAAVVSATAKLKALGLTDAEVSAMLGV